MSARDDDRISYLAGDAAESLTTQERAELDELRELLRAPATWVEPDAGLEDRVVSRDRRRGRRGRQPRREPPARMREPPRRRGSWLGSLVPPPSVRVRVNRVCGRGRSSS